jgi:hypothetical protein
MSFLKVLAHNCKIDQVFPTRPVPAPLKPFQWNGDRTKHLAYGRNLFGGTDDCITTMDPHSPENIHIAFNGRVNPIVPLANPAIYVSLTQFTRRFLRTNFVPPNHPELHEFLYSTWKPLEKITDYDKCEIEWLNKCDHYTEQRKNQLYQAFKSCHHEGKFVYDRKIFKCKSFPKREIYPEPKKVRLINARSDKFKAIVGPVIKMIEEIVYKLPEFVKGDNPENLPNRLAEIEKYKYKIETDYTSFESCFVPQYTASVELQLFEFFLQNNPEILKIIKESYYQNGKPRVNVMGNKDYVCRCIGSRMSGEMWTSLANGFSNYINIKYIMATKYPTVKYSFFVEGDDGIIGVDEKCLKKEDFTELGFNIKLTYHTELKFTSFCGNLFHPDVRQLVVNPQNIVRLFWTTTAKYLQAGPKVVEELIRAKAMSAYTVGQHTPILAFLAYKIIKIIGEGKFIIDPNRRFWLHNIIRHWKPLDATPVVCLENRVLYEEKFGIMIQDQLEMERGIMQATTLNDLHLHYRFMNYSDPCLCY